VSLATAEAVWDAATGQIVWREKRFDPRQLTRALCGRWAAIAREYSLRGLLAYLEMVPRDMNTQGRWQVPEFHREWHQAAFLHRRLNLLGPIEHGKSQTFTLGRLSWEIGHHPEWHYCILSQSHDNAKKRVLAIRNLVKEVKDYQRVFPGVRPAEGDGAHWTQDSFTVTRPNVADDNPTLYAWSVHGKGPGARLHGLVLDDAVDEKSTRTAELRKSDSDWIRGTAFARVFHKVGFIWNLQNHWHKADFGHELQAEGWPTISQGARHPDGRMRWHERLDVDWYVAKKKDLGILMSSGLLDGNPRSDTSGRFREEWARRALQAGLGQKLIRQGRVSGEYFMATGADPAHKKTPGRGDRAAIVTLLGDGRGAWSWLWGERDSREARWGGHGMAERVKDHRQRYPDARIFVEDNGGQALLIEFLQDIVATIEPINTGTEKTSPDLGLEAMFAEMGNGAVALPCDRVSAEGQPLSFDADPIVAEFISQCFDYEPGKHTGDLLMAAWIAWKGLKASGSVIEQVDWRRWS
jgi:hypothetical protein